MTPTLRRLSVAGLATTTAVVASLLVAPSASAAITAIEPNTAFNSETAKDLVFRFGGTGSGTYLLGGAATFTRLSAPAATFTVDIDPTPSADGKSGNAGDVDFTDVGDGLFSDGPADAGTYSATAEDRLGNEDSCTSCFTVQSAGPVAVTALSPSSLRAGQSGLVTVTGNNFERGSRVELLFPGTTTVDSTITPNLPPPDDGDSMTTNDTADGITTRTTLRRTFTVATGAVTGARDVRITNADGNTATFAKGFSVNGAPLTSTNPTAGNNDPDPAAQGNVTAAGLTRVTFTGAGLNTSGVPFLQYTADPGSSTRDALTVRGTIVGTPSSTTFVADFDLRNAAPAAYLPVVRNPDGSSNACGCSFTVAQSPDRNTTVTSLDRDTATAGNQKSQPAGTTQTFLVTGTGFAQGTRVVVSGTGVTTTAVQLVSATQLRATLQSTAAAAPGDRDVTAVRTDGATSAACSGCYTVTTAASASPSPSSSPSPSASASSSPAVTRPTVNVNPSTITAGQKSTVFGRAVPGSTVEIYAYSRPSTTYVRVRTGTADEGGAFSFVVGPSGNTRLYARSITGAGSADSDSVVLTVRTSLNLKVARTGTRTYRFTGSTLPKRRGQLVTVFYENSNGSRTIASRARVAEDGTYNVTRQFSGSGTFVFFTGTGTDNNNAGNNSNRVRITLR